VQTRENPKQLLGFILSPLKLKHITGIAQSIRNDEVTRIRNDLGLAVKSKYCANPHDRWNVQTLLTSSQSGRNAIAAKTCSIVDMRKNDKTFLRSLETNFRYGLLMQRFLDRLKRVGLDISLHYLIREGVQACEMNWPDLTNQYSSSVLDQDDVRAVAACSNWITVERIQSRLHKGHLCVILKHGEQVAGYTWVDFDEINNSDCYYEMQPGDAYLYDAFIVTDYRGRGLAPYMRFNCYQQLRDQGRHTFYSISDYFNKPSIRFKRKLSAEIVQLYLQIKIGTLNVGLWVLKDYN